MSIIHVNQIGAKIREMFEEYLDKSDLNEKDPEYQTKILTRCLAAYGVFCIGNSTEVEAASSVTDGANDNGIDAIYYSPTNKRMVIVQSKWKKNGEGEPESGDIRKFRDGVKDLFNFDFSHTNNKLNNRSQEIKEAMSSFDTKYDLVVIHTGSRPLAEHSSSVMNSLVDEMNDTGDGKKDEVLSFYQLNQSKIHSSLAGGMDGEPIDLDVGLFQWGKVDEPHHAYYGMVSGEEVYEWYKGKGKRLFSKNIRQILGTTEVNTEIKATIENEPANFWYYNNGITVVADSISKSMAGGSNRDMGNFHITNISIVNGAQTVSTVGSIGEKYKFSLSKVRIPIRLISLENAESEFESSVTRNNNRQNRIENRDFVSQDLEQIRIRQELIMESINYNIVRSESFHATEQDFDLVEATTALACVSGEVNLAVQVKREIGKFYENLDGSLYRSLFNPRVTGVYVYNVVISLRKVDALLKSMIGNLRKRAGREYGLLVHGNRFIALIAFKRLALSTKANTYPFDIESLDFDTIIKDTVKKLGNNIDEFYPDKILGSLFKNKTICSDLYQKM